eukprot:458354-Pyramimonas_sp.AAC.1
MVMRSASKSASRKNQKKTNYVSSELPNWPKGRMTRRTHLNSGHGVADVLAASGRCVCSPRRMRVWLAAVHSRDRDCLLYTSDAADDTPC